MPPLHITKLQFLSVCQRLLTREEEDQIDDSVLEIRRERIADAERKQKLGAGLVNVIREMPEPTLGSQLLGSKRFRTEMRKLGVASVSPGQEETIEGALVEALNQSRVRGELLSISIGKLAESEQTCKDQAAIIRNLRASKRRQMLWSIGLSTVAVVLAFAIAYLVY